MGKGYRVEWSIVLEADDHVDAALQAWATLDDSTTYNQYATVLFVEEYEGDGSDRKMIDMEDMHMEDNPRA
jgi:hypothetical protein